MITFFVETCFVMRHKVIHVFFPCILCRRSQQWNAVILVSKGVLYAIKHCCGHEQHKFCEHQKKFIIAGFESHIKILSINNYVLLYVSAIACPKSICIDAANFPTKYLISLFLFEDSSKRPSALKVITLLLTASAVIVTGAALHDAYSWFIWHIV